MRSVVRLTKSRESGFGRAVCVVAGIAMTALIPGFARGQVKGAEREAAFRTVVDRAACGAGLA